MAAAEEAADCSKSHLISLPRTHERSPIAISARSVTANVQGVDGNVKAAALYVNIWRYVNIQQGIKCAHECFVHMLSPSVAFFRTTQQVRQRFSIDISQPRSFLGINVVAFSD